MKRKTPSHFKKKSFFKQKEILFYFIFLVDLNFINILKKSNE